MVKLPIKREKNETPAWAQMAKMAEDFKRIVEEETDPTYLVAVKSVIDRLQKILERKIQELEKRK